MRKYLLQNECGGGAAIIGRRELNAAFHKTNGKKTLTLTHKHTHSQTQCQCWLDLTESVKESEKE